MNSNIISTQHDLNNQACTMMLESADEDVVYMSSVACRWLSVKIGGKYLSEGQEKLITYLDKTSEEYETAHHTRFNANVLLYKKPTKDSPEALVKLLKAGADVRYLNSKDILRIVMVKNQAFLSLPVTDKKGSVVGKGLLYNGLKEDPLIEYYRNEFMKKFGKAQKLKLNSENRIVYDESFIERTYQSLCDINTKDVILLIAGALLGLLFAL